MWGLLVMQKYPVSLISGLGTFAACVLIPALALACACCADPGQRSWGLQKLDGYIAGILSDIQFGPVANLYVDPCDLECVEGVGDPSYTYDLIVKRQAEGLNFALVGKDNESRGAIRLQLPDTIETFATDPAPDPSTMSPILYKEWRLATVPSGDGAFGAVTKGHTAELVLIGRGNSCDSDADFTHWILDARGDGVGFRLFGALDRS